jgi:uncharacterized membrane protein YphA (DoxX/SURF4 family)
MNDVTLRSGDLVDRLIDPIADRLRGPIIGLMRIVAGTLWLANLEWKRPPAFGEDLSNGLYKYVDSAVRKPVFGPFSWFIENVVLKQYRLFGWVTLVVEVLLAVCLLLGFRTRIAALIGAVMSVNILLSVLNYDKADEWAWSYYLMVAVHLLLFAVAAGNHWGVDGVRRGATSARSRAVMVLGIVAMVVGVLGVFAARKLGFAAKQGAIVGYAKGKWELKLVWLNLLSALLTIVVGAVAVAAGRLKHRSLALVAVAGFGLMALQVLIQWRSVEGVNTGGFLGGTGGTLAFWLMLAVGIGVCLPRPGQNAA